MDDKDQEHNTKDEGVLGTQNEHDSEGKLLNSGEKSELMNDSVVGVDEFLQNDQHPDEKNVSENVEKLKVQEENPDSVLAETAEKSTVESSEQQGIANLGISGTKRKAETSEMNNEETPEADELQRKFYCSLCEVSTTSEGTLNHHMQGRKHKAKEAKFNKSKGTTTTTNDVDSDSSHSLLLQPPVGPTNDTNIEEEEDTGITNSKFHCSICQVSTNSEALLKSHLQGKKHKAKKARLGIDPTENVPMSAVPTQWYCSLCHVSAASEKNLQEHLQGKKHKAKEVEEGINLLENVQETTCDVGGVVETEEKRENEVETKEENKEMMKGEMRKHWHCKMCDVGAHDEASMEAHRKSKKHMEALRENCGGVIVVSIM